MVIDMEIKDLLLVAGAFGILLYILKDPPKVELPPGVTMEQAIQIVKQTDWVQNTARGLVTKLFGVSPADPRYEEFVDRVSEKLAIGILT